MYYIKRDIEQTIIRYTQIFPVVAITGPRQSGKSTTLKTIFKEYRYITFDDMRVRAHFENDPYGFMEQYNDHVIFDEVQKAPEIFDYIKLVVDQHRDVYGRFILTGFSQFTLVKKITESLAGRIGILSMLPFRYTEMPESLREESIYRGSYPEVVVKKYKYSEEWYSSYINTYLEKDVRALVNIGDLKDFRRLIELLAANTSHVLNMSQFASDIGVTVQTVKRWISVLEASYIIFLLPSYHKNYGKRIVKSPKIYFYDTGLVSYIVGIESLKLFENGPMSGAIFENYMIAEINKKLLLQGPRSKIYYFRNSDKEEIDLIVDLKTHSDLIEIKYTKSFKPKMTYTVEKYLQNEDLGYLLYRGENFPYKKNIKVINYSDYLK